MSADGRSPVDFLQEEVYPALFERLDSAFPEFGWKRTRRGGWVAKNRDHTKKIADARPDRVVCNQPWGFYVHGGSATSWIAYVSGGTATPTGRDFVDAVRKLAARADVDAASLDRPPSPEEEARRRRGDLLEAFMAQARAALLTDAGKAARDYLVGRGFREDELEDLEVGLYTDPEEVKRRMSAAGYIPEDVEAAGLIPGQRTPPEAKIKLWPGRLVIAWRDRRGRLATFAARDLTGKAEESDKYLYRLGTKKAELVAFGLDEALRPDAGGRDRLVLVEGLLDVVHLHARGFLNVAGIGGGGGELSAERWSRLAHFGVRSVTLAQDFDPKAEPCKDHALAFCVPCAPGMVGTLAALDNVHKGDKAPVVYVVDPTELYRAAGEPTKDGGPAKVDPDELVRLHGLEAFRAVLEKRVPGAVYRGVALLGSVTPSSPDHERREAVERVARYVETDLRGSWAKVDADAVLEAAAERTGYGPEALEPIVRAAEESGRREAAERDVDRVLANARAAREGKTDALEVARTLAAELAGLQARTLDAPLPFSVERLERETRDLPGGKLSGWEAVDSMGVRFHAGELALLAARTSHGKTSALVGLLLNWLEASGPDELVVFYSHEEPEVRIFHRLLALLSRRGPADGWTSNEVRDYLREPYSRETWPDPKGLEGAKVSLRGLEGRLLVVHRPGWNVEEVGAHARALSGERKVGAVLVDYLQRVRPPKGSYDRRDIEVSVVGRALKALAVDLAAPVVVGAQINRESIPKDYSKSIGGKSYTEATSIIRTARPDLSHLREGGSEQEADLVLGLLSYAADYRTEAKAEEENRAPAVTLLEVGVLKNRYGAVGSWAGLAFEGRFNLLRDPEGDEEKTLAVETVRRGTAEYMEVQKEKTRVAEKRAETWERAADKRLEAEDKRLEAERVKAEAKVETERLRLEREKLRDARGKGKKAAAPPEPEATPPAEEPTA